MTEPKFNWDAEDYAKHSKAQQTWANELIAKLHLHGNESVLDIGCGDGKITAEIAWQVPNGYVLGTDNSQEMIELAQGSFTGKHHPNLSFEIADARRLPFRDQFDLIFSNAALHWIKDHEPVLGGIYRSLKPGGRALLQMGGKGNAGSILSTLDQIISQEEWNAYFSGFTFSYGFYSPAEYTPWIVGSGLRPLRTELIPKDMSYDNKAGLTGWVRTTWLPYLERVPEERREEFVMHVVNKYLEKYPPDSSGKIHVDMIRLEVEATKNP